MITGVEIKYMGADGEIYSRTYIVGQKPLLPIVHGEENPKVKYISESGGMENRLTIGFEGGRRINFNLTASNIMAWRTQVDGYYDKDSKHQQGQSWPDMPF